MRLLSIFPKPLKNWQDCFVNRTTFKKENLFTIYPPAGTLGFFHPKWNIALEDVEDRIKQQKSTCILTLGALPQWFCLEDIRVGALRGTTQWSDRFACKVLPTFDLDSVYADQSTRHAFTLDISKALTESTYKEIRRKDRIVTIVQRPGELRTYFKGFDLNGTEPLACDIETEANQVTSIAFSWTPERSVVVPFWDKLKKGWSAFTREEEALLWIEIATILAGACPKLFHNGVYDVTYLQEAHKIAVCGPLEDSMLMAHALQPELPKSLGHLGSLYANEGAWKELNRAKKKDLNKKDA